MADQTDRVIRAITDDGAFRVMTIRATDTVQRAVEAQDVRGETAQLFGELVTAAVLVRETMAPGYRVQVILRGSLGGQLVGDSHPGGLTRGLVQVADRETGILLGDDALLQVIRVLPRGDMQQGIVSADLHTGVSGAVMGYLQRSEQVTSMLAVGCVLEDGTVKAAGGYLVQLLPEVTDPPLMVMTERLEDFRDIRPLLVGSDSDPQNLMGELFYGFPHTLLAETDVAFGCLCSPARVVTALAALGRDDIAELVAKGEAVNLSCDYCGKAHAVGTEQLRTLLEPS